MQARATYQKFFSSHSAFSIYPTLIVIRLVLTVYKPASSNKTSVFSFTDSFYSIITAARTIKPSWCDETWNSFSCFSSSTIKSSSLKYVLPNSPTNSFHFFSVKLNPICKHPPDLIQLGCKFEKNQTSTETINGCINCGTPFTSPLCSRCVVNNNVQIVP